MRSPEDAPSRATGAECRIGTSGWIYPHWRDIFYPRGMGQARWFGHYAARFDTVEINYSFYRLPSEQSYDQWRVQAPPGFLYAVKANRYLTHVRRLMEPAEPLKTFLDRTRRLETHLGPILYQLPPRWRENAPRLAEFAELLPRDLHHVFEFRDPRWFTDTVRNLLAEHRLSFCIYDMPGIECPHWITGPIVYIRFHGSSTGGGGRYTYAELRQWAARIREFLGSGRPVYIYFNNDLYGHALTNARELRDLLQAA